MAEFISTKNLSFSYPADTDTLPYPALKNINLSIEAGEYVAVLGHNGSGKSTLAKLLNMILLPTEGQIFIGGRDITAPDFGEDDMFDIRRRVGMVFQNPDNQIVATTVEEDVAFGPENLGVPREEIRARVDRALETVGMTEYKLHAPHRLSGGQKQRVAIAGVLAMNPECIIFDESTAMLDPLGRREVLTTIRSLNESKRMTVLLITHHMEEAAQADRVIVINDGEIYMDGTPREIFQREGELRAVGLEVPQSVAICNRLRERGYEIGESVLYPEECTDALAALLTRFGAGGRLA